MRIIRGESCGHSLVTHPLPSMWEKGEDISLNSHIYSKLFLGFISEPGDEEIDAPGAFCLLSSFYSPWTGTPPRSQK